MERSEGYMSLKNPVTPPGIDSGTVRLVAQRPNHYATPGPLIYIYVCVCVCVCVMYKNVHKSSRTGKKMYTVLYKSRLILLQN
jgi:hypothetical protein